MAQFLTGDMWNTGYNADVILVTANSYRDKHGHLIMGAGAALQMKERWELAPKEFGRLVRPHYGVIILEKYGIFQTKSSPWHPSDLTLIRNSTSILDIVARVFCDWSFYLNYPGIGLGARSEKEVFPIVSQLPDNVFIWKKN